MLRPALVHVLVLVLAAPLARADVVTLTKYSGNSARHAVLKVGSHGLCNLQQRRHPIVT